jgi:hypothetical protein
MAPRRDAPRKIERVDDAVFALHAQQPRHKHTQQRSSTEHSPPLLQPNVDASDVPVRRERWRRRVTAERGANVSS